MPCNQINCHCDLIGNPAVGIIFRSPALSAKEAVIFVTIFTNLKETVKLYGGSLEELDKDWIKARKDFFQLDNVIDGRGIDYLKAFERVIAEKNLALIHSQFINRNDSIGFGVFVVSKQ